MKTEIIQALTINFESFAKKTESDVEFWLARDLQQLLGYTEWRNFLQVVNKAKTACEISKHIISDHFADVGKKVSIGSGAETEITDIMLTRYACYLIPEEFSCEDVFFDDPQERFKYAFELII